jgi:hypothetical protein
LDATNVEQAFRSLIADIYRNWAARMDAMKEDSNTISRPVDPILKPGYPSANNSTNNNAAKSCCGSS